MEPLKRCSNPACSEPFDKPCTREFFSLDTGKTDGLKSWCRVCTREARRKYRAANLERVRAANRLYRAANAEAVREYGRRYHAANPEAARERARRRRAANPEVVREATRESVRRWKRTHPEAVNTNNATRRALKRAAVDPHANLAAIKDLYDDAQLVTQFTGIDHAVDHITPLARGGKHCASNLRVIPARLNSIKGAKLDHEVTSPEFTTWIAQSRANTFEEHIVHYPNGHVLRIVCTDD